MSNQNFAARFSVDQTPEAVFTAICNVRGWWSEGIEGQANKVGDRFIHSVLDLHRCDIAVKEMIPGRKVVWRVVENYFSFTKDKSEWTGTEIVFEIARSATAPSLASRIWALASEYECYDVCRDGWTTYINSLRDLVVTGRGQPNIGEAKTESEQTLVRAKARRS